MTTRLSVNINKIATLRNARGGSEPSVTKAAVACQEFGAQGITVHPRPDERHITYQDVRDLRPLVTTEFNVEGYPTPDFMDLVLSVVPEQVTLVPDPPGVLTSNAGWDTLSHQQMLQEVVGELKAKGIRTSLFLGTEPQFMEAAVTTGTDRVELYTEPFASNFSQDRENAVAPFSAAASLAFKLGLGVNAGHDLSHENLRFFAEKVPHLLEVSIGHALVSDALYWGLENTVQLYLRELDRAENPAA